MKNSKGLIRLMAVYNGMLFTGKSILSVHDSVQEDVYLIESGKCTITLTKNEALELSKRITNSFKDKE